MNLKNKFSLGILILTIISITTTSSISAQERVMADKIVAVVGKSAILYSEIDEVSKEILRQRREGGYTLDKDPKVEALENLMTQKLLYHQAQVDSLKINTDDIDEMINEAISDEIEQRGSSQAVELYHHKPIFNIRSELCQKYEEARYASQMKKEVESNVMITPGEVEQFFKKLPKDSIPIVPEQYVYSQIVMFPPSMNEAKQRTRERLLDLRDRISKGARFDALARIYSQDPGTAMRGGELDFNVREGFEKSFGDALSRLSVNQISGIVETSYGFHIIQLLEVKGNKYRCRHILLTPQYSDAELQISLNRLDSIANNIRQGKITFAQAAALYSEDKYSKLNSGIVTNHEALEAYNAFDPKLASSIFFKENIKAEDFMALRNLKEGEISQSFTSHDLRGNIQSKIVMLNKIHPAHPASLEQDYLLIEQEALNTKKNKVFNDWLNKKIASMYVHIDSDFRNADFENKSWFKKLNIEK